MSELFELNQLPALPQLLTRLIQELSQSDALPHDIADLIEQDAVLTLKILSAANAHHYAQQAAPVSSLEKAIVLLGLKKVALIVLGTALQNSNAALSSQSLHAFATLWAHSLLTAIISRTIAQFTHYSHPDEAYLAGLLHDIGKLTLLTANQTAYLDVFARDQNTDETASQERLIFGTSHTDIGAALVDHWHLEPLIAEAIRQHHAPATMARTATTLEQIVFLANRLSHETLHHPAAPHAAAVLLARNFFGMSAEQTCKLVADCQADAHAITTSLGLTSATEQEGCQPSSSTPAHLTLNKAIHAHMMLTLARDMLGNEGHPSDQDTLLANMAQTAEILCESRQAFLFQFNAISNKLSGRPLSGQAGSLRRIQFELAPGNSLLADALLENVPTRYVRADNSETQNANLTDQQIARLAGTDALLCLPMVHQGVIHGCLVLTLSKNQLQRITADQTLMQLMQNLTRHAAQLLFLMGQEKQASARESLKTTDDHQLRSRQIIHEVSNPLSVMKNYLKILELKLTDKQIATNEFQILNAEIDRIASIVGSLANAAGQAEPKLEQVSINELISDLLAICKISLFDPVGIHIETQLDAEIPLVFSDKAALKQVFMNLLKNAAEAMPHGGVLKLSSATVINDRRESTAAITLTDTGPGIPKDRLSQIFLPVQTQKGAANAGLGLSISADILKSLNASILCKSTLGVGTTFEVVLPLNPPKK